jgi:uncharacterized SAM-binding protein YcdF (DUF218 family)
MDKPGSRNAGVPISAKAPLLATLRLIAIVAGGICVLWLAGLLWFATPPESESRTEQTDAIVVLTGGSLRLQSGLELLREGRGRKLFVSGVGHQVELDELLRISGNAPDWALCCVALGHDADNTFENARETAQWMHSQGFHSLRLVTAWYHMPRSHLEFSRAMPEIDIVAHPVFPAQVKQEHWWAWRGTAALLIGEYVKYLAALVRPLVEWVQPAKVATMQAEMRR